MLKEFESRMIGKRRVVESRNERSQEEVCEILEKGSTRIKNYA